MYNNNSDVLKLEMKEKIDDIIKKTSVVIDRDQANALMKGERVSNKHIPDNIAYTLNSHFFKPVVIVEYTREAFCMNLNRIRITFDSDLKKQEHDLDFFSHDLNLHKTEEVKDIILEVKFNNFLPKYISNLLTFNNTDRLAISKYCFSRDIIY